MKQLILGILISICQFSLAQENPVPRIMEHAVLYRYLNEKGSLDDYLEYYGLFPSGLSSSNTWSYKLKNYYYRLEVYKTKNGISANMDIGSEDFDKMVDWLNSNQLMEFYQKITQRTTDIYEYRLKYNGDDSPEDFVIRCQYMHYPHPVTGNSMEDFSIQYSLANSYLAKNIK